MDPLVENEGLADSYASLGDRVKFIRTVQRLFER